MQKTVTFSFPNLELCTSLIEFDAWLLKQETRIKDTEKELTLTNNEGSSDLKHLPLDKLIHLTDPTLLPSTRLFAKCLTLEGKSMYDSKFDYNQPIGTIIHSKEFDENPQKCGHGIHLVLPHDIIRLAIMYHYLGHQDLKICFVTIPHIDPYSSEKKFNKVVKSKAFNKVEKIRVDFVEIRGFVTIQGFARIQNCGLEGNLHDQKNVWENRGILKIVKPNLTSFSYQNLTEEQVEKTLQDLMNLEKSWETCLKIPKPKEFLTSSLSLTEEKVKKIWQSLQILYCRMCMTLNCKNLESPDYASNFVEILKYLDSQINSPKEQLVAQLDIEEQVSVINQLRDWKKKQQKRKSKDELFN